MLELEVLLVGERTLRGLSEATIHRLARPDPVRGPGEPPVPLRPSAVVARDIGEFGPLTPGQALTEALKKAPPSEKLPLLASHYKKFAEDIGRLGSRDGPPPALVYEHGKALKQAALDLAKTQEYRDSAWWQSKNPSGFASLVRWIGRLAGRDALANQVDALSGSGFISQLKSAGRLTRQRARQAKEAAMPRETLLASRAVERFRAKIAGNKTRRQIVMPSEIRTYLQANLADFRSEHGEPVDLDALSKALAREVVNFAEDPSKFSGHGKRLELGKSLYAFPRFDKEGNAIGAQQVAIPVGVWVRPNGKGGLELELIGDKLGSGTYKDVFRSRPLEINLQTPEHAKRLDEAVLVRSKPGEEEGGEDTSTAILGGLKAVKSVLGDEGLRDPELRLAGMLSKTSRTAGGLMEARDAAMAGSWMDLNSGLSSSSQFQILADTAQNLEKFHAKGLVHRDVKPANILISREGSRGHLSDFDLSQRAGLSDTSSNYVFWDLLSKNGLVTPLADIKGLAHSAAAMLFGADYEHRGANSMTSLIDQNLQSRIEEVLQAEGIRLPKQARSLRDLLTVIGGDKFREALSPEKRKALEDLGAQFQPLLKARNLIDAVFHADDRMLTWIRGRPEVQAQLENPDASIRELGMKAIYLEFPIYQTFLRELRSLAPAP